LGEDAWKILVRSGILEYTVDTCDIWGDLSGLLFEWNGIGLLTGTD